MKNPVLDSLIDVTGKVSEVMLNKPYRLVPRNGHFNELLSRSIPPFFTEDYANRPVVDGKTITREDVIYHLEATMPNGSSWIVQLEDLSALYVKPLVARIDTLRRKLIPFCNEIVSGVDALYTKEIYLQPDIREVEIPVILREEAIVNMLAKHRDFSNITNKSIRIMGGFDERDEAGILDLLQTGNTKYDDMLAEMIAGHPEGWLKDIYTKYFRNGCDIPGTVNQAGLLGWLEEGLIVYLIIGNLINRDIIDSNINLSLDEYKNYIYETYALVGGCCYRNLQVMANVFKSGAMVIHENKDDKIIFVYGDIYRKYLEMGGDVESLLGSVLMYGTAYLDACIKRKDEFVQTYQADYRKQVGALEASYRSNIVTYFGQVFTQVFDKQESAIQAMIANPAIADFNPLSITPDVKSTIVRYYIDKLTKMPMTSFHSDVTCIILNDGIIKQYGLWQMYVDLNSIMEAEPELAPQHAAYRLVVKEVARAIVDGCVNLERAQVM